MLSGMEGSSGSSAQKKVELYSSTRPEGDLILGEKL
jgi:hypothetical protein